jgi:FtsP/CotA-like multicopper oxidase with cupredoxin domain
MTRNQRIGLLAAALVVAVVAFVIAQSGGDDNDGGTSQPAASGGGTSQTTDTSTEPTAFRISVKGGVVDGDTQTFTVKKNDTVRIVVTSDAPDQIHLHGYDIEKEATPGKPARFKFKADVEGAFIIESHAAEDAGNEPLLARLHVEP